MMKWTALPLVIALAGCATTEPQLIAPEYKIIKAPDDMYRCPVLRTFPKSETLTDQEVGSLILKLQKNNITCKNSLDSIKQFYDGAEKTISQKNS
ncbi:hypothetical protein UFOVP247_51 [uncultured Caudovirales phage]|uniref:Lipoprotein n=1 Tax=uncultured Caudovirales phage TaxID=2100421 RepID=A0A6J7WW23_9CAUD|nr:hypothetical protein UFOVP247_51 [uncultured Caudovirales phage]